MDFVCVQQNVANIKNFLVHAQNWKYEKQETVS